MNRVERVFAVAVLCIAPLAVVACGHSPAQPEGRVGKAKDFITSFWKGDVPAVQSNLDSVMRTSFTPERIEQVRTALRSQVGDLKVQEAPREGNIQGYNVVYVPCDFEKGLLDGKVVFNATDQVSGFFFVAHGHI